MTNGDAEGAANDAAGAAARRNYSSSTFQRPLFTHARVRIHSTINMHEWRWEDTGQTATGDSWSFIFVNLSISAGDSEQARQSFRSCTT